MLAKIKNPAENGVLEIDPAKAVEQEKAGYGEVEHVAIFVGKSVILCYHTSHFQTKY